MRFLLFSFCICMLTGPTAMLSAEDATGFLEQHCFACHGADAAGDMIRLDQLTTSHNSIGQLELWTRVIDAVDSGEMPPPDEPQPDKPLVENWIEQVTGEIHRSTSIVDNAEQAGLRRLNRREYENTVHELLGIDVPLLDLLPEDGSKQGFDNVSTGLSFSSVLMEQYLEAADVAFDAVIRRIKPLPAETRRVELMTVKENIDSVKQNKGGTIEVDDSFIKFTPGWPPARIDPVHPIEDGIYRCRIAVWPHDPGDRTLAVAIYVGALFGPETRKFIGNYNVTGTSDEPRIIEFVTRMDEGHAIHILPRVWPEHITWRDKHEARPGVGIAWVETYGPVDQSFPSEAQKKLFGDRPTISMREDQPIYMRHRKGVKLHIVESSKPESDAIDIVQSFAKRAFRRPVSESELQPFVQLTVNKLNSGRTFEQAVRAGVTAILCSPQFLLVNSSKTVDDFTVASRLSYFLWSSMPDDELLRLAENGKLKERTVLRAQTERMLKDQRSRAFIENFTGQWLNLRDIEFTTPDAKLYPEFDPLLQDAMLSETRSFFAHVLSENLSVTSFIDSDWTFLNERLARHYGIEGVHGHEHFTKVALPEDSVRGGLLTHGSVLKVTANGTTTSPVIRGVWVLDKILSRPAPPPPPGVPAVEPDVRGATSIREQLDKHRNIAACASCHNRIDPPGFAMEVFDPIGGERTFYRSLGDGKRIDGIKSYRQGPDVESAGVLANGDSFAEFEEYRQLLAADPEAIARAITIKLCVYATGREIGIAERHTIDRIVRTAAKDNYGLKSLLHALIESELFTASN